MASKEAGTINLSKPPIPDLRGRPIPSVKSPLRRSRLNSLTIKIPRRARIFPVMLNQRRHPMRRRPNRI
jgi:hypothetical protein